MDTNLDGLNLSLKELKNHLDALGITKPEELNSLRKIWRQKFKYLSNIEWSSSTKLNESLQNLESSYSCLESINLDDLKGLLILHSEYLFGKPNADVLATKIKSQVEISLLISKGIYVLKSDGNLQSKGCRKTFLELLPKVFSTIQFGASKEVWEDIKSKGIELQLFRNSSHSKSQILPDDFWNTLYILLMRMDIFVVSIKASSEVNHTFAIIEANIILHNSDLTGRSSLPSVDEWESNFRDIVTDPSKFALLKENNPEFILTQMLLLTMGDGLPLASCRDSHSLTYKDLCILFCNAVDLIVKMSLNLQEKNYQISLDLEQVSVQTNTQSDETGTRDIDEQVKAQSLVISALRDELSHANDQLKEAISKGNEVAKANELKEGMIRGLTDSLDRVRAELREFQSNDESLELSKLRDELSHTNDQLKEAISKGNEVAKANELKERMICGLRDTLDRVQAELREFQVNDESLDLRKLSNEYQRLSLENDFKERKIRDLIEALNRVKEEQKVSRAEAKTWLNHSLDNSSDNKAKTDSGNLSFTEIISIIAVVVISSRALLFFFSGNLNKIDPPLNLPDTNHLNDKRFSR